MIPYKWCFRETSNFVNGILKLALLKNSAKKICHQHEEEVTLYGGVKPKLR